MIRHQRIGHKELQACLKPILSRINQYTNLDLQLLRGAADALELLSDWFNKALGEKLLDHLKKWLDPDSLMSTQRAWQPGKTKVWVCVPACNTTMPVEGCLSCCVAESFWTRDKIAWHSIGVWVRADGLCKDEYIFIQACDLLLHQRMIPRLQQHCWNCFICCQILPAAFWRHRKLEQIALAWLSSQLSWKVDWAECKAQAPFPASCGHHTGDHWRSSLSNMQKIPSTTSCHPQGCRTAAISCDS